MSRHSRRAASLGLPASPAPDRGRSLVEPLETRTFLSGTAPVAAFAGAGINQAGDARYNFGVIYADNVGVDPTTLSSSNIVVTGPNGFTRTATLVSVDSSSPSRIVTGIYSFIPPHGSFDVTSNGTYSVAINPNQVKDVDGNAVVAGTLGSFDVNMQPVTLSQGVLSVNGTGGNQTITVTASGTSVTVNQNGTVTSFNASDVQKLHVGVSKGIDTISNETSIPSTILGGRGHDTITGGSGNDSIVGGPGHDSIDAGAGDDTIRGRRGFDTMRGGSGHDSIRGGYGDTQIFAGTGGDLIVTGAGNDTIFAHNGVADTITGNGVNGTAHVDNGLDSIAGVQNVLNS